ncbi:MAG: hypothetical protein ABSE22_16055 [Xanthobacteraceae bacterium]|jgi:hypothetical protein
MSISNDGRDSVGHEGAGWTIWTIIVAAVLAVLIVGGAIYSYSYSGNDTSPAATDAPPRR